MAHKTHYSSSKEAQKERIEGGIRRLREGQERKEGQERRDGQKGIEQQERRGGQERREGLERKEGKEKRGQKRREGWEEEGRECPCQETYHPSGSPHELVLPTKGVSTGFIQQQRTERVPAPAKLVHVLP